MAEARRPGLAEGRASRLELLGEVGRTGHQRCLVVGWARGVCLLSHLGRLRYHLLVSTRRLPAVGKEAGKSLNLVGEEL